MTNAVASNTPRVPGTPRILPRDEAPKKFPKPSKPRVMVVVNQKGGVGKTTTTVNLAACMAQAGLKVLVIDMDPQGNASTALGIPHHPGVRGSYEVLLDGVALEDVVVDSPEAHGLQAVPATVELAGAELQLVQMVGREQRLARAVRDYMANHEVDYIFFDCPPSLGLLTLNALVAANEVLIPIQCEYYALEGVSQLMNTVQIVQQQLNPDLDLSTVLLTMFDARTKLAAQVAREVRRHFDRQTLDAQIPRSVRIAEAPSFGQTLQNFDPTSAGAKAYRRAALEIARRGKAL